MRAGKSIALAIILLFGIVMQCEIFQTNLGNFDTGEYQNAEIYYETGQERTEILSEILQTSEMYGVHPFVTVITFQNEIEKTLCIYGDETVRDALNKEQGITDKLYSSLASGITQVEYRDFGELLEESGQRLYTVSFVGDSSDIFEVCEALIDTDHISYPAVTGANEHDMTYIIWITIDMVMLLMTILCVAVKKKEVTIRISMGQDIKKIVLKYIAVEILIDLLLFLGVRAFCLLFLSGEYMAKTVLGLYLVGIGISCITYFSFAFYDIRRAFSNVFVTRGVKNIIYVLKFIVSVGTVFTIITNISLIMQNRITLGKMDFADAYQNYSYLELADRNSLGEDVGDRWENLYEINNRIYTENYDKLQPAVSGMVLQDGDSGVKYVLVNEYGAMNLEAFANGLEYDREADVIYFIPEQYDTDATMEDAKYCLEKIISDSSGLKEQVVVYHDKRSYSYVNRNLEKNMSTVSNPVVIYAAFHGMDYKDRIRIDDTKNVMFRLTDEDVENLKKTYSLEENGYEMIVTKVTERFEYYNNLLRQGISFCSSIAIFILFLNIILTVTIVITEYRNNAMELSVKKILGYSLVRRSLKIVLFSVISNVIVIAAAVVIGICSELYTVQTGLAVGIVLLVIDLGIEMINILRIEKESMLKTLKGGCL